jgi:Sigma-54 interaction domain
VNVATKSKTSDASRPQSVVTNETLRDDSSPVVPSRFEANLLHYFVIRRNHVFYEFEVFESAAALAERTNGFWKRAAKTTTNAPPYTAGLISQLVDLPEIPKSFRFGLQYVVTDCVPSGDSGCIESPQLAISYDVVFAGDRALRSATFDILPASGRDEFIVGQLKPVFEKLYKISKDSDIPGGWRSAGFIDHEVEISAYDRHDSNEGHTILLKAKSKTTYRRSPYGEFASAYVLPRFDASKTDRASPIVLAGYDLTFDGTKVAARTLSPVVRQNLEALELGMSAPAPKIVFVQGEPGSGKEGFAKAIHFGSRLNLINKKASPFSSRSVAGMDLDQFHFEVLGEMKDGILVPGLITKSKGGSIFLDEFDKLDDDADTAYSELLRIWEAKQFVPVNGREVIEADELNWVVAGAFTSTRTTSDLPPDIWSRFTTQIAIQSPISSSFVDEAHRIAYIRAVIFSFMLDLGTKRTGKSDFRLQMGALCRPETRLAAFAGALLFDGVRGMGGIRLEPSPLLSLVADVLARYLGSYWVAIFERKDASRSDGGPATLEYCFPRGPAAANDGFEYVKEIISKPRAVREWMRGYSRPPELSDVIRCYDSIRAVRQACQVVYDRLFELVIQKTTTIIQPHHAQKFFNEAFNTIDLARRGSGLERLLGQEKLQHVRFEREPQPAGQGDADPSLADPIVSWKQLKDVATCASAI